VCTVRCVSRLCSVVPHVNIVWLFFTTVECGCRPRYVRYLELSICIYYARDHAEAVGNRFIFCFLTLLSGICFRGGGSDMPVGHWHSSLCYCTVRLAPWFSRWTKSQYQLISFFYHGLSGSGVSPPELTGALLLNLAGGLPSSSSPQTFIYLFIDMHKIAVIKSNISTHTQCNWTTKNT